MWTEYQAWTYLARRWDVAAQGGQREALILRRQHLGLCGSLRHLYHQARITSIVLTEMESRIPRGGAAYVWPMTVRGARQRAAFCRKMAGVGSG